MEEVCTSNCHVISQLIYLDIIIIIIIIIRAIVFIRLLWTRVVILPFFLDFVILPSPFLMVKGLSRFLIQTLES